MEQDDVILADKGFPHIETNIAEVGGVLVIPPFKQGSRQFKSKENADGYKTASVRIHVERMKRFNKVLHFLCHHHLQVIDDILIIIAGICNCLPDLINDD